MKINITWSTEEDSFVAGKMCAKKAVLDLVQTKIAILYSSAKNNTDKLIEGAKSILGSAPIIGCTTSKGIITQDGFITNKFGFAGMMGLGDEFTAVGTAISSKNGNARLTGKKVAIEAMKKINTDRSPEYFMIVTTPGDEEEYIKGIQDVIGNVPCFGGTASDEDMSGDWKIYTEDAIVSDGVAVAFFYTNKEIKNILEGKYHETINSGVITKINGNREIDEINGIQALKQYAEWTKNKVRDVRGVKLIEKSILKPLAIKDVNGDFKLIKQLLNGNTDYSINVNNNVSVNTCAIQMQISKDEISTAPSLILRSIYNDDSEAFLIQHNASRFSAIENDNDKVENMIKRLKKESNNKPFLMIFDNGEFGRGKDTMNVCGSLMVSETMFNK